MPTPQDADCVPFRSLSNTLLFALHIEVAQRLNGLSPAAFFEHATGISRMTYQRGRGYVVWQQRREEVQAHADSLLLRMLEKRGTTDEERAALFAGMPQEGTSQMMVYMLGLLDGAAPATRDLLFKLDASDRRLCRLNDANDGHGFAAEIGPESELGPDFCQTLFVSGLARLDLEMDDDVRAFLIRAHTRRAHMALNFLAALDHEIAQWNSRVAGFDAFNGLPRIAVLLADPEGEERQRYRPNDPIARLVDFAGVAGHRARRGSWPDEQPSIADMGTQAERSGALSLGSDGPRFVRGLRSGKHPMTRAAFLLLVSSQVLDGKPDPKTTDLAQLAEDFLDPYLVAAHLLSLLMGPHRRVPGHLDRMGWRRAYLDTWARWVQHFPPVESSGVPLPGWLLDG